MVPDFYHAYKTRLIFFKDTFPYCITYKFCDTVVRFILFFFQSFQACGDRFYSYQSLLEMTIKIYVWNNWCSENRFRGLRYKKHLSVSEHEIEFDIYI